MTTQGQIQLMLRGYGDPDTVKTTGVTTAQTVQALNRAGTGSTEPTRAERRPATAVRRETAPPSAPSAQMAVTPTPPKSKVDTNTVTVIRGREISREAFAAESGKPDSVRTGRS